MQSAAKSESHFKGKCKRIINSLVNMHHDTIINDMTANYFSLMYPALFQRPKQNQHR